MAEKKIVVDIELKTGDSVNSLKSIKQELKDLKNIQLQFAESSDEYIKASQKIGKLKDTLADANDTARVLTGNVAENLTGAFSRVASAGIGAFQAVEGAQAVFGVENKDLQKQMVKLQGLLNLSAGVKEFANIGQSAKDFKTVLVALIPSLFAETAAVEGATVAQTELNLAMYLNPIGLVVAALALLVTGLIIFSSTADESAEATDGLTVSEQEYQKSLRDTNTEIDKRIQNLKDEIQLIGLEGEARDLASISIKQANDLAELDVNKKKELAPVLSRITELQKKLNEQKDLELRIGTDPYRVKLIKKIEDEIDSIKKEGVAVLVKIEGEKNLIVEASEKNQAEVREKYNKIAIVDAKKAAEEELKALKEAREKLGLVAIPVAKPKPIDQNLVDNAIAELDLNKQIIDGKKAQGEAEAEYNRLKREQELLEQREAVRQSVKYLTDIFKAGNEDLNSNTLSLLTTAGDAFTAFSKLKDEEFDNDTERFAAYAEATLKLASSLLSDISNNNKAKIQERLDDLNSSTEEELTILKKRKDDGLINEKQFKEGEYKIRLKAFNDEEKLKKQLFEQDKKAKIAQATIAGIQGAIQAYTGAQSLPIPPPGPQIIGGIAAAAVLAFTAKNIAKIQSTQYKGGTAPSAPDSGGGGGGDLPTPNTNAQPTPSPQLLGFGDTGQNNLGTPTSFVRAIVLESDITNAQIRIKNYQTESQL